MLHWARDRARRRLPRMTFGAVIAATRYSHGPSWSFRDRAAPPAAPRRGTSPWTRPRRRAGWPMPPAHAPHSGPYRRTTSANASSSRSARKRSSRWPVIGFLGQLPAKQLENPVHNPIVSGNGWAACTEKRLGSKPPQRDCLPSSPRQPRRLHPGTQA